MSIKIIEKIITSIIENEDIDLCMAAGCELVHEYDWKKNIYKVKTKYPVAIRRDGDNVIVWENPGLEKINKYEFKRNKKS